MRFSFAEMMKLFFECTEAPPPKPYDASMPFFDGFNWDNCDPVTNGEFFLVDRCASQWNVCFDIGANMGEYAARVLARNPVCRVCCFEPNRTLHDAIRDRGVKDIIYAAVGECAGTIAININQDDTTQSSIHRNNDRCRVEEVPVVTVDDYLEQQGIKYVSFMKIDTEGHELAVLRGASTALAEQRIGMLQFEYGGTYCDAGTTLREVFELLQDRYLVCHLFPQGWVPVPYAVELETFRYSNWVAVSRSLYSRERMVKR